MRRPMLVLIVVLTAMLLRQDSGQQPPQIPVPAPLRMPATVPVTFTAATFNVGLAPGLVALSEERAPVAAEELSLLQVDVLCLQEVWIAANEQAIVTALGLPSANVHSFDTTGLGNSADERCAPGVLNELVECTTAKCADLPANEQTMCVPRSCRAQLASLYFRERQCLDCVISGAGMAIDEMVAACEGAGMSRIFGGRNGVVMASRFPLQAKSALVLPSSRANRVALFARIDIPKAGAVEVACTHLSAPLPLAPDHPGFSSWEEEQSAQLEMIADQMAARAQDGVPQLLLADTNFGPDIGQVHARSEEIWEETLRLRFESASLLLVDPQCSTCPENALRRGEEPFLIDHLLSRNGEGKRGMRISPVSAERLFVGPVGARLRNGATVITNVSDHYGVRATFALR